MFITSLSSMYSREPSSERKAKLVLAGVLDPESALVVDRKPFEPVVTPGNPIRKLCAGTFSDVV